MSDNHAASYRQIRVGQTAVGMTGLDEVLAALCAEGYQPDSGTAPILLARVRRDKHLPPPAEADYAEALLYEYRRF
jgi:hypothetical protein